MKYGRAAAIWIGPISQMAMLGRMDRERSAVIGFTSPEPKLPSSGLVKSLGREGHRVIKGSSLTTQDKRRCLDAIAQFGTNPGHPGMNFERLGSHPNHNH